jgi:hypothetical protein
MLTSKTYGVTVRFQSVGSENDFLLHSLRVNSSETSGGCFYVMERGSYRHDRQDFSSDNIEVPTSLLFNMCMRLTVKRRSSVSGAS